MLHRNNISTVILSHISSMHINILPASLHFLINELLTLSMRDPFHGPFHIVVSSTHTQTHTPMHMQKCIHIREYTHTQACAHITHVHTGLYAHMQHIYTRTHIYTHTHTCNTHSQTYTLYFTLLILIYSCYKRVCVHGSLIN